MITLLFRQTINIWNTLERRHKAEAFLLLLIVVTYISSHFNGVFSSWLQNGPATPLGLTLILVHVITLPVSLSMVFVNAYLLPRNRTIPVFYARPLDKDALTRLLLYYNFNYLGAYLVIIVPLFLAFMFSGLIVYGFLFLILSLGLIIQFLLLNILLQYKWNTRRGYTTIAFNCGISYHILFGLFYWFTDWAGLFVVLMIIVFTLLIRRLYQQTDQPHLEDLYRKKENAKANMVTLVEINIWPRNVPRFLPGIVQELFKKEVFSLWRNPRYVRLKIFSTLFFLALNAIGAWSIPENKDSWLVILAIIFIWAHYNSGFNEKYARPDPDGLVRLSPLRFRHYLAGKYFAEIGYALLCVFITGLALVLGGIAIWNTLALMGLVFIFANVVLLTMLNFQIMFYNSPRLAGYAYHFSLLFMMIIIINYHLVGPIISLALMLFYFYKNIRYFNA